MTTETSATSVPGPAARSLNARRVAGISGIVGATLFTIGNALWALDWPAAGAPAAEIADFYRHTSDRVVIGASLSLLAIAPSFSSRPHSAGC